MPDVFTREKRSEVMSRIRSRKNKRTELTFLALLRKNRITGWRRHYAVLGRPDFAFPSRRLAIFLDGCFWHGCPRCYRSPRTHKTYWREKVRRNKKRDQLVGKLLKRKGWRVIRLWEHDLQDPRRCLAFVVKLKASL